MWIKAVRILRYQNLKLFCIITEGNNLVDAIKIIYIFSLIEVMRKNVKLYFDLHSCSPNWCKVCTIYGSKVMQILVSGKI